VKTGNLERKKHYSGNWGPMDRKVLSNLCHERLSPEDKKRGNSQNIMYFSYNG
jgi:hypothetical protein